MKCNRYAIYGWKSKKSVDKFPPIILGSFPDLISTKKSEEYGFKFLSEIRLCEGEIESQVELEWLPYMGGADANIEVRFRCKNCEYEFAGDNDLPYDVESLNKFLTKVIKEM
jgi:hypothetical protein